MFDFRDWAFPFKMYPNLDPQMFRKLFLEKQKKGSRNGTGKCNKIQTLQYGTNASSAWFNIYFVVRIDHLYLHFFLSSSSISMTLNLEAGCFWQTSHTEAAVAFLSTSYWIISCTKRYLSVSQKYIRRNNIMCSRAWESSFPFLYIFSSSTWYLSRKQLYESNMIILDSI